MSKQTVVPLHNGVLLSDKENWAISHEKRWRKLKYILQWKRPVWKWYVVQTIGHSGKDTTTDTVKKKKIEGRVEKDELGEQRNFLGQWNYCIWYCNDGYMTLCICQNQLYNTKSEPLYKLWTLLNNHISILAHQQIYYTNERL